MSGIESERLARVATVRQCVIDIAARGFAQLHVQMREMLRFGVRDFVLVSPAQTHASANRSSATERSAVVQGVAAIVRRLPLKPAVRIVAGELHALHALLDSRFWLCTGEGIFAGNLAVVLAQAQSRPHVAGWAVEAVLATGGVAPAHIYLVDRIVTQRSISFEPEPIPIADYLALHAPEMPAGPGLAARPALFLDRDGVINVDCGWVGTRERFEWIDGARDAVAAATNAGLHVFIVTNQAGVARGYYSEADVVRLHDWMCAQIHAAGGTIDEVRYCPYHPQAALPGYRAVSNDRKPGGGMILDVMHRWELQPSRCILVGDKASDLEAAAAANIRGFRFPGGNLATFVQPLFASKFNFTGNRGTHKERSMQLD